MNKDIRESLKEAKNGPFPYRAVLKNQIRNVKVLFTKGDAEAFCLAVETLRQLVWEKSDIEFQRQLVACNVSVKDIMKSEMAMKGLPEKMGMVVVYYLDVFQEISKFIVRLEILNEDEMLRITKADWPSNASIRL